jgi:hypothetical protein
VKPSSSRQPVTGYIPPQSDGLQQPNTNGNHNDYIQNGLDAGGHGDKPVDQVQRHADHDQRNNKIYQRHFLLLLKMKKEQSAAQSSGGEKACLAKARRSLARDVR